VLGRTRDAVFMETVSNADVRESTPLQHTHSQLQRQTPSQRQTQLPCSNSLWYERRQNHSTSPKTNPSQQQMRQERLKAIDLLLKHRWVENMMHQSPHKGDDKVDSHSLSYASPKTSYYKRRSFPSISDTPSVRTENKIDITNAQRLQLLCK
jgi:hypothetical protein